MKNFIRASAFVEFIDLCYTLGVAPDALLHRVNISVEQLKSTKEMVPIASIAKALELAADLTACQNFGLRLAERIDIHTLAGPIILLAQQSGTTKELLEVFERYAYLLNCNAEISVKSTPVSVKLIFQEFTDEGGGYPQFSLFSLATIHQFVSSYVQPKLINFNYPEPGNRSVYKTVLNAPLQFDAGEYSLVYERKIATTHLSTENQKLKVFFNRYLQKLDSKANDFGVVSSVTSIIHSLLHEGVCSEEAVAEKLHMGRRTLQRKLKAEGTSFNELFNKSRIDLADYYLLKSNKDFMELAFVLGFSQPSSFTRFIKAHFGVTPSEYREGDRAVDCVMT